MFIRHEACDACGSSDGKAVYEDHTYCFVCKDLKYTKNNNNNNTEKKRMTKHIPLKVCPSEDLYTELPDRGLTREVAKFFGIANLSSLDDSIEHLYPYEDSKGNIVASKIRRKDKKFPWTGSPQEAVLFGQNKFPAGQSKFITIVEGELDAASVFQMFGMKYPVVSVKNATSAVKDCASQLKYLTQFEQVVICMDKDSAKTRSDGSIFYPGQEAAEKIAKLFPIGTVRVLTLEKHKDPNDYLVAGDTNQFIREWWNAPVWSPRGIRLGSNLWDAIIARKEQSAVSYPWEFFNEKTYGIRTSEFVLLHAPTGVGKTSICKEIEHHLLTNIPDVGVGILHIEEPNEDTALGLMSITANKPLHLPEGSEGVSVEELKEIYNVTVNTDRLVMWDHFGSNSIDEVITTIRFMVGMGCKYIFLDHITMLVSAQTGDERKQLDEAATKLKTLCMELDFALFAVIHENRSGQIRGSDGVGQLANTIVSAYRDVDNDDENIRNITQLRLTKNRFGRYTGPAAYLKYNFDTARMEELSEEEVQLYLSSSTPEDFEYSKHDEWKNG